MRKFLVVLFVAALVVLGLALAACASAPGAKTQLCEWVLTAEAACDALQPMPPPPPSVRAEIVSRAAVGPGQGVTTTCAWIKIAANACRAGQPMPAPAASVARDLTERP